MLDAIKVKISLLHKLITNVYEYINIVYIATSVTKVIKMYNSEVRG
jgi:hypothetical protein